MQPDKKNFKSVISMGLYAANNLTAYFLNRKLHLSFI
jgi:hypothetical protein